MILIRLVAGLLVVWWLAKQSPRLIGRLARLLDWFDDRVWKHRTHKLCCWIEAHYPTEQEDL